MLGRAGIGIMVLIGVDVALSSVAVVRYPALLQQHLAWMYLLEPAAILLDTPYFSSTILSVLKELTGKEIERD